MELSADHDPVSGIDARWLGRIEYQDALALQESLVARKIAGEQRDYLLLLEHDPVYTLGRGADAADLRGAPERLGVPVHRVGRGGGATFHGPGQLVAYPLIQLAARGRDVHRYVRTLEQSLIETCADFGVAASTRAGITGVWVGDEKIASIGIGVRRGITLHGIALNVSTELDYFAQIVPCRLPALRVTTLARVGCRGLSVQEVGETFARCFGATFGYGVSAAAFSARRRG